MTVQHSARAPILTLEGLSKSFGGVRAVDDLDLAIAKGELRCLIGPNGAGKSTVFKLITGLERPTSGEIRFHDQTITGMMPWKRARAGLSIKMQIPSIYSELSVYENVRVAAQHHVGAGEIDSTIRRVLDMVNLSLLSLEPARNLSHGQQQWLEIGMALSANPSLLLLDEPTAGMGPAETRETAALIQSLNEQGITITVIDHDMSFVRQIARKVSVLHLGKLFAEGSIEEIESNEDVISIYLGKA